MSAMWGALTSFLSQPTQAWGLNLLTPTHHCKATKHSMKWTRSQGYRRHFVCELSRTNEQTVVRCSSKSHSLQWTLRTIYEMKETVALNSVWTLLSPCFSLPPRTHFIPRYSSIALFYSTNKAQMQFYCPDQNTEKFIALMPFISSQIGRVCCNWGHFS